MRSIPPSAPSHTTGAGFATHRTTSLCMSTGAGVGATANGRVSFNDNTVFHLVSVQSPHFVVIPDSMRFASLVGDHIFVAGGNRLRRHRLPVTDSPRHRLSGGLQILHHRGLPIWYSRGHFLLAIVAGSLHEVTMDGSQPVTTCVVHCPARVLSPCKATVL